MYFSMEPTLKLDKLGTCSLELMFLLFYMERIIYQVLVQILCL